jgi:hypothetical protein
MGGCERPVPRNRRLGPAASAGAAELAPSTPEARHRRAGLVQGSARRPGRGRSRRWASLPRAREEASTWRAPPLLLFGETSYHDP